MADLKYRQIGFFKSRSRAHIWAKPKRDKGKKIRVETRYDPTYGKGYVVMEFRKTEVYGENFKLDLTP